MHKINHFKQSNFFLWVEHSINFIFPNTEITTVFQPTNVLIFYGHPLKTIGFWKVHTAFFIVVAFITYGEVVGVYHIEN